MDGEAHYLTINKCLNENFPILCANFWPKFGRLYRSVIYGSIKLYGRGSSFLVTHVTSVTRIWLFGHLQQWKIAQWHKTFAKVGSKFCQILNKPSKFCQSGEISPNLVTLFSTYNDVTVILILFCLQPTAKGPSNYLSCSSCSGHFVNLLSWLQFWFKSGCRPKTSSGLVLLTKS